MEDKSINKTDIARALKTVLAQYPDIKPTKKLLNTVYTILKSYYLEDKKYVILEAPTGSGKTIIGMLVLLCSKIIEGVPDNWYRELEAQDAEHGGYYLTSNKTLQDQLQVDIDRFKWHSNIHLLKGTNNYPCLPGRSFDLAPGTILPFDKIPTIDPNEIRLDYEDRKCEGFSNDSIVSMKCYPGCPYKIARQEASTKFASCMNYYYWIKVLPIKKYFNIRSITICDEAHLAPQIFVDSINLEITYAMYKRFFAVIGSMDQYSGGRITKVYGRNYQSMVDGFRGLLHRKCTDIKAIYKNVCDITDNLKVISQEIKESEENTIVAFSYDVALEKQFRKLRKSWEELRQQLEGFIKQKYKSQDNFKDIFIDTQYNELDKAWEYTIRDLNEGRVCKKVFLNNCDKVLFMSATIGNFEAFMESVGIDEELKTKTVAMSLQSDFDFSESPVYCMNFGKLTQQTFQNNIDSVLKKCVGLVAKKHPEDKGIIHTVTFEITQKLQEIVNTLKSEDIKRRFLFYSNSEEKQQHIETIKNDTENIPYVICGPSLYEGIDLKDDMGRFNIVIKVPYTALTKYIQHKIERYPLWYDNDVMNKTVQAIGRTNRHKADYSTTYLLDSKFSDIVWTFPDIITDRLRVYGRS